MKLIKQFGIIFTICWLSQVIEYVLPFHFPASVIGLVLLLFALLTGMLKIEHVREKSDFLLANMSFFFIPAGVSMMNYFEVLKNNIVQIAVICIISTILTFAATAYSIKLTMRLMKRRRNRC